MDIPTIQDFGSIDWGDLFKTLADGLPQFGHMVVWIFNDMGLGFLGWVLDKIGLVFNVPDNIQVMAPENLLAMTLGPMFVFFFVVVIYKKIIPFF